tara:strand:- start:199 stop:357 length:159 start_codon:yes stop_codon:yes gene_type:complete
VEVELCIVIYCFDNDVILQVRAQKQPTGTAAAMLVAPYRYENEQALLALAVL